MATALKVASQVIVSTGTTLLILGGGSATDLTDACSPVVMQPATDLTAGNHPPMDLTAIEEVEDRLDLVAARAAMAEPTASLSYSDVRRELGLK